MEFSEKSQFGHLAMPGGLKQTRRIPRFPVCEVSPKAFVNIVPQYRLEELAASHPAIAQPLREAESEGAVARQEGLRRQARD